MKIKYLKLKNFINIEAGMKKKEIEIDFSNSENNLIVLIGKNGSGKTSILSELHPFATSGNMDVRNDVCLIKEGCDGYKEIHIQDKDDLYVIKHNYLFKNKTKSVKSYISKNGVELNANGNVTSFKELVYENLGLDQDLLKLMRLGSNVTSLINMKSTNRKAFATKLFSDMDVYNGFYKKVCNEYRNIRAVMKNISGKLSKYNVSGISDFQTQENTISIRLEKLNNDKNNLIKSLSYNENIIKNLDYSDYDEVIKEYNKISSDIIKAEATLDTIDDITIPTSTFELNAEKEKNLINKKISDCESNINKNISERDIYYSQLQEIEEQLKTAVSNTRVKNLEKDIENCDNEINKFKERISDKKIYDKLTLLRLKDNISEVMKKYKELEPYTHSDIKYIAGLILNNENVRDKLEKNRLKLVKWYDTFSIYSGINEIMQSIGPVEYDCDINCPYKEFYQHMDYLAMDTEKKNETKKELDNYDDLYNIDIILKSIKSTIDSFDTSQNIPIDYNTEYVFTNIINNKPLIKEAILNIAIDNSETYEYIEKLEADKNIIIKEYEAIKEYGIDTITLENKILKIKETIEDKTQSIYDLKKEKEILDEELERTIEDNSNKLSALRFRDEIYSIKKRHDELNYRLKEITKDIELKEQLLSNNKEIEKKINELDNMIRLDTKTREEINYKLKEYSNLTEEYEALNLLFKDIDEVKDALNASTGIPLLYLNVYLKNCPIMMNSLLESVFDGNLQINSFIINENEFRIPFTTKGALVPDIIHASQGESSFISIVLSLSLIIQSMTKYDIICLDELDGPLDAKNREEFINILYKFISQVNCEQVFLITHNNMFDNEPVDLILTSNVEIDNFKYGNVVFKA